ncbi:MAG: TfoX/Sxy family protein [Calditrichaeota bacterium]|nr:TfoX/Sxy family protein [Calditrichota bacterium]
MKLSELPNIGKELEKKLISAGIHNQTELRELGSLGALKRIIERCDSGCLHLLYALEGAIQGIRWHYLSADDKRRLKAEFIDIKNELKRTANKRLNSD